METEEFEKIVLKVLNYLKQSDGHEKLLVFSGDSRYLIDKFFVEAQQIGKRTQVKVAVDLNTQRFLSESKIRQLQGAIKVYGYNEDADLEDIFEGVDMVVIGSMDINNASKISNLTADSLSSKIASQALSKGIRLLSNDFMTDITTTNSNYHLAVKRIADTLESYGVEFIPVEEIKKHFDQDKISQDSDGILSDLVTEKFIKEFQGNELKLKQDVVITPLAKDAIRERKIHISRGE
jgi:hypothetical protein